MFDTLGIAQPLLGKKLYYAHNSELQPQGSSTESRPVLRLNCYRFIMPGKLEEIYILSLIHISEPTRRTPISYAVFCLKKKS